MVSIENITGHGPFPGAKMFTIRPGINITPEVGWEPGLEENVPLVFFWKRSDLTQTVRGEKNEFRALPKFGDRIGQTIIVCNKCHNNSMGKDPEATLDKLLQKEFHHRMAARYNHLCRSLLDHSLLVFDAEALEKYAVDPMRAGAVDTWEEFLLELRGMAPQEHIRRMLSRLEPLATAIDKKGKGRLKAV